MNNGLQWARLLALIICIVITVYGSMFAQSCSAAHPIVFDAQTGRTVSAW